MVSNILFQIVQVFVKSFVQVQVWFGIGKVHQKIIKVLMTITFFSFSRKVFSFILKYYVPLGGQLWAQERRAGDSQNFCLWGEVDFSGAIVFYIASLSSKATSEVLPLSSLLTDSELGL